MKEGGRLYFLYLLLFICFPIFDIQKESLHQLDVGGGVKCFPIGFNCVTTAELYQINIFYEKKSPGIGLKIRTYDRHDIS